MSLDEELKKILLARRPDAQYHTLYDVEIDQILTTISKHLPENPYKLPEFGYETGTPMLEVSGLRKGFDKALIDVNKLLTTNKKGKV